jgi:hypothetical protein
MESMLFVVLVFAAWLAASAFTMGSVGFITSYKEVLV